MRDGFLNLLKPPGMTSSDAVVMVRKTLPRGAKVGHMGTLDPEASGVLPIGIGKAARLFDYVSDKEKGYRAEIRIGIETDTQDATGRITGRGGPVTAEQLEQIREHDSRRLEQMTFYSTTQDCLRGFLLHYFGEAAPKKCGNCSCCLAAEQEAQLQVEYSRRRAADNARRLTEKPRRTKAVAGELSEFDEKLLNALYAQRKRLAGKQNIPAFMVFSDATLREMVEKKPLSTDELLNISGVGEKKAARYGNAFLRIIEDAVGSRE